MSIKQTTVLCTARALLMQKLYHDLDFTLFDLKMEMKTINICKKIIVFDFHQHIFSYS